MATKSNAAGVNKSQEIRDALKLNPKAKSSEIVAALAAKGIKIANSLVYMVKSQMKHKQRRQKRELAASTSKALGIANPVDLILKVKGLAADAGGIRKLKQLVDVMAE
jgi:hypothetical protein